MPNIEQAKPLVRGLNLGADAAQSQALVVADGVRFPVAGVVSGRLGRKRLSLVYPDEGIGTPADYTQTIAHFTLPGRPRGVGSFFDQRIETRAQEILDQRDFTTTTKWTAGTDWSFTAGVARFDPAGASPNRTLTQANADLLNATALKANTTYVFEYDILVSTSGNISLFILTTAIANQSVSLPFTTNGHHRVEFTTGASPTDFVIEASSTGAATIDLDNVTLKEKVESIVLPERLNFVSKVNGWTYLNEIPAGPNDILDGEAGYNDPDVKAKIIPHGNTVFIVDGSTRPKVIRRLPVDEQQALKRIQYEVRTMGIHWPRYTTEVVTLAQFGVGGGLPKGVYRFRVALENKFGDYSSPSVPAATVVSATGQNITVTLPPVPNDLQATGDAVTHWRIYFSFTPSTDGTNVVQTTPSAYKFWKKVTVATTSQNFGDNDFNRKDGYPLMEAERGAPPILRDYIIVNGTAWAIAERDIIQRETLLTEGERRVIGGTIPRGEGFAVRGVFDNTEIKDFRTGPHMLMFSPPGEPLYLPNWIEFARKGEFGVGLAQVGDKPVLFTNQDIIVVDPVTLSLVRVHSRVGALTRDGIQETERGIRFMASDGVPRIFNGATVEEVATELMPVFDQEDYKGPYKRFDRRFVDEVSTADADRRFYMNYPVATDIGSVPSKPTLDVSPQRNMAIGDSSQQGPTVWSIDRRGFEQILWIGELSRLVGVDFDGSFYYLEEGLTDEGKGTTSSQPTFEMVRRFGAGFRQRFARLKVEIDTAGQNVALIAQVDEKSSLVTSFTVNTQGRRLFERNLPGTFKGLYLDVKLIGLTHATAGRVKVYDMNVEEIPKGVY